MAPVCQDLLTDPYFISGNRNLITYGEAPSQYGSSQIV